MKKQDERKFYVWYALSPVLGHVAFVPGYVLPSVANARLHWRALATLKERQRNLGQRMAWILRSNGCKKTPCTITLVRNGVRLLDDDNLAAAFKHVRDGIAEAYGVDDGPNGPIVWKYEQARAKVEGVGIDARWSEVSR